MKKFYRSKSDRKIAGIFGGLGAYFNVDSTWFRLAYLLLAVATGIVPAIIIYIIGAIVIPEENNGAPR